MITLKSNDYIVGVWMAMRYNVGKVFIYSVKGNEKDQWFGNIKYVYNKQEYNLYMSDNDHINTFIHADISELDIIKICNDRIAELQMLFCHEKEKILIGGDILKYEKMMLKNKWMPRVIFHPESKLKKILR